MASGAVALYSLAKLWRGGWVVSFPRQGFGPDWSIIRALLRFGLPTGIQGIVMNIGGVFITGDQRHDFPKLKSHLTQPLRSCAC